MSASALGARVAPLDNVGAGSGGYSVVYRRPNPGEMSLLDYSALACLTAGRRPRKILEIGTGRGLATLNLAQNAPEAMVYTFDVPRDPWGEEYLYRDRDCTPRIHQYTGEPPLFDFHRAGRGISFCLMNAPHEYEDLRDAMGKVLVRMIRPEMFVWRDPVCGHIGRERGPRCGMTRFLEEIADLGVVLIEGTSLAVLPLAREAKPELARRLGVELPEE